MFNAIFRSQIYVLDRNEALDFHVGRLGLEVKADADCRKTYETLLAKGVEFTEEPTERPYGVDCGLRDPFGNRIRFTQPNT